MLVSPAYPPPFIGGSSVYVYTLIENSNYNFGILTSKIPKNSDYLEITSKRQKIYRKSLIHFSVNPKKISLIISYIYQVFWIVWFRIKTKSPIVLTNGEVVLNSLIILLGKILRFSVIPISYAEEITTSLKGTGPKARLKSFLLKSSYPLAFRHISCCHFVRDILVDEINISSTRTKVIPIAFSDEKIPKNRMKKISNNRYNILSVGRMVERKGFIDLIQVVKKLKNDFPALKLNIVGHGPLENDIQNIIKNQNLDKYIFFHGKVTDKALNELYLESDLFVLAHRMLKNGDTEGSPITFAEAGLYKLPSIGGLNSGASTIINHKETGLIIDTSNKAILYESIKNLFLDRKLMIKMGEKANLKILNEHSPKKIGKDFSLFLDKLYNL